MAALLGGKLKTKPMVVFSAFGQQEAAGMKFRREYAEEKGAFSQVVVTWELGHEEKTRGIGKFPPKAYNHSRVAEEEEKKQG